MLLIHLLPPKPTNLRVRSVGLYYFVRRLAITPAARASRAAGRGQALFLAAGIIGLVGTFVFAATLEERYAS